MEMRGSFHRQLGEIDQDVLQLFSLVSEGIAAAADAFLTCDTTVAETLAARDELIDALYRQIEEHVQRQLALQHQAFTLITAPEARPVLLRSDKADSGARGLLLLKPDDSHAVLIVQDLPPLPQDRAYQLWLGWGDRQRDNGGVFRVDAQGFGLVYITAPQPFTTYQRVGITEEPASGSPGPTSPRVIGGTP